MYRRMEDGERDGGSIDCGERQRKVPWSNTLVVKYNVEEKRCMARTV